MAQDTKTLSVLTHILGIVTACIGPLLIYLLVKDKMVKKHAVYTLNWTILATIGYIIASVISWIPVIGFFAGIFSTIIFIVSIIFGAVGASNAAKHKLWKYPISYEFVEK
jgi:uncharacterized protein